ncbi:MAG TPA: apolipoprotein N-acyltransferase [Burkholderiales bacterium]|nr:apolipoprotein N-acyltransferase [Burkholderiales bacterium]
MTAAASGAVRLAAACTPGAVAMALGAVSVAGFGDWPLWLLPLAAFAALAWLWLRAPTPGAAAAVGFAFGAGLFFVGASWVYVSLHDFGGLPAPLAGLATIVFCSILAAYPAAAGWAQAKLSAPARAQLAAPAAMRLMLVIPALWTLAEWLRSWIFTGFPWLSIGYSQLDGPLAGFAPVGGMFAVSFLATAVAGALVALLVARGAPRIAAIAVIGAIAGGGWGLRAIDWTAPYGEPLDIALLQGNIPQALKFVPGRYQATLETYARLAGSTTARLVVLPETAIPRFLDDVDPAYLEALTAPVAARGGDMLIGVPLLDRTRRYYNAVVSFGASPRQAYAKSHLVPFGEFVPTGFGWLVAMMRIPLGEFARGAADQQPLAVAGERVAVNICYEDAFGEEIIRQLPAATLLANVSNVAWFGNSLAPAQHLRISRMRAVETGRFMLRATNTGVTAIVAPDGSVAGRLPSFSEGVLEGRVQGRTGATPYVTTGNAPILLACLAVLAAAAARTRAKRRRDTDLGAGG